MVVDSGFQPEGSGFSVHHFSQVMLLSEGAILGSCRKQAQHDDESAWWIREREKSGLPEQPCMLAQANGDDIFFLLFPANLLIFPLETVKKKNPPGFPYL